MPYWASATIGWTGKISLARPTASLLFLLMTVTPISDSPREPMKCWVLWAKANSDSQFVPDLTLVTRVSTQTSCYHRSETWQALESPETILLRISHNTARRSLEPARTALVVSVRTLNSTPVSQLPRKEVSIAIQLLKEGLASSRCSRLNEWEKNSLQMSSV